MYTVHCITIHVKLDFTRLKNTYKTYYLANWYLHSDDSIALFYI